MEQKTNVVLVHGAWADESSSSKVIPLLLNNGFDVSLIFAAAESSRSVSAKA